jgi:hypothetical protein
MMNQEQLQAMSNQELLARWEDACEAEGAEALAYSKLYADEYARRNTDAQEQYSVWAEKHGAERHVK